MRKSVRNVGPFLGRMYFLFTALRFENCLLKSLSKFQRHNAIKYRINCTAGKIANTRDIIDDFMDLEEIISPFGCRNI